MSYHDTDLMRRIELERAEAGRDMLDRVIRTLQTDSVNPIYRAAYARAIRKLYALLDFKGT